MESSAPLQSCYQQTTSNIRSLLDPQIPWADMHCPMRCGVGPLSLVVTGHRSARVGTNSWHQPTSQVGVRFPTRSRQFSERYVAAEAKEGRSNKGRGLEANRAILAKRRYGEVSKNSGNRENTASTRRKDVSGDVGSLLVKWGRRSGTKDEKRKKARETSRNVGCNSCCKWLLTNDDFITAATEWRVRRNRSSDVGAVVAVRLRTRKRFPDGLQLAPSYWTMEVIHEDSGGLISINMMIRPGVR